MGNYSLGSFLFIVLVVLVSASIAGYAEVTFATLLVFAFVIFGYLWNLSIFRGLYVHRTFSESKVEFGAEVYYRIEMINRKLWPVMWLRVEDSIPYGLSFANSELVSESLGGNPSTFRDTFSLNLYQRVKRSYAVTPNRRGLYQLEHGHLFYADPFGVFSNDKGEVFARSQLIVYPEIVNLESLGIEYSQLFGTKMRDGWVLGDPLNKVGTRSYQSQDSIKRINWKASARHLELQADIYKPASEQDVHVFLNYPPDRKWWVEDEQDILEWEISCAASLIDRLCRQKVNVNLYTNLLSRSSGMATIVRAKSGRSEREKLLTTLALLHTTSMVSICDIMHNERRNIPSRALVFVLTPTVSEELRSVLLTFDKRFRIKLLEVPTRGKILIREVKHG